MQLQIKMFDRNLMHLSDYECDMMETALTMRAQMDIFATLWWELKQADYKKYDGSNFYYNYSKLILDEKLIYSGEPLTADELQSKLKHLTRRDYKLENKNDKTTV